MSRSADVVDRKSQPTVNSALPFAWLSESMSKPLNPAERELVVLVHGLASTQLVMLPLAWRLRRQGYETRSLGYYSIFGSNRRHGSWLARKLHALHATGNWSRIHLVVHSMGSIVTRCAMQEELPDSIGRVVMIGPPNGGSHMATRLRFIYGFCTPLLELMDRPDSFVNQLPPPPEHFEIGILAAAKDNVIDLERTHLQGERDHCVLPSWHTGILWHPPTADYVGSFLRLGHFSETVPAANNTPVNPAQTAL